MGIKRPGVRIPFGVHTYRKNPDVEPPGLLRLLAALAILSIVGTMLYSALAVSPLHAVSEVDPEQAIYIAILHFLLPIAIAYTIMMNHGISRLLILTYFATLYAATVVGKGVLGALSIPANARTLVATMVFATIVGWLYRSPKMRYYYALLSDKPIPDDLASRDEELAGHHWLSSRTKGAIEWLADHLETVVLLGFVVVVVYAFWSTG